MMTLPQAEGGQTPVEMPTKARSHSAAIALGIILIALGSAMLLLQQSYPSISVPQPTQSLTSPDWSGYSISTDLRNPQPKVTTVSATWTIPKVTTGQGNSFSAAWIGIGGQFDQTLIQVGTQHDSSRSSASYAAWYELLPDYPVTINQLTIKPGDTISASIALTSIETNTWTITITDVTTGRTYTTTTVYDSSMLSAEWVVERPTVGNRIGSLSNFGEVTFSGCSATVGGKTGSITSFPSTSFVMINRLDNALVSVSPVKTGGSSFTVSYLSGS